LRRAAMKVRVFQWPCGTEAASRWPRGPAPERRHVGFDPGLVKEDQSMSLDPVLVVLPALPFAGDVRSRLLGWQHRFF
ncbi:hypothetical protein ACCS43_36830, partial [Rhizobium ruizarguesonis]